MKLSKSIEQRIETPLPDNDYDRILVAARLTRLPINELIDFSERNWEEDKFRFNDQEEVLEEMYIDFTGRDDDLHTQTAYIMFLKFPYSDLATAIALNKGLDVSDVPGDVWSYVMERAGLPLYAELGDEGFAEAERQFVEFNPDFSNRGTDNGVGFCKESIKQIREHLAELGYFGGLGIA